MNSPRKFAIRCALSDESGGVTVLAFFSLLLTVICVGFAIDASNLYRHQAVLRTASDAAAHAGATALARGATERAAKDAALEILARNMAVDPTSLLANPERDLRAVVVNPTDGTLTKPDPDTPANAILVNVQQSEATRNPIPTLLLGLFGFDHWSAGSASVAVVAPTRRCTNASGLYAQGPIRLGPKDAGAQLGDAVCVHSQAALDLPNGRPSGDGKPLVSLPSRADCAGKACAAAVEINLIMSEAGSRITRLTEGFTKPNVGLAEERAFFASRPIARDLEPLLEVGADATGLRTGSVVRLSPFRFRLLREVPSGLVYRVLCGQPDAEIAEGGKEELVIGEWPESPALRDAVLVTNCPLRLSEYARIEGALVISTAADSGLADASPGARIGDPARNCDASLRSVMMVMGDLELPFHLMTSNIAVVASGSVKLGRPDDRFSGVSRGLAVHAGGMIIGSSNTVPAACPGAEDPLLPSLRVISHTMPPLDGWITSTTPEEEVDLPGVRPERLSMQDGQS